MGQKAGQRAKWVFIYTLLMGFLAHGYRLTNQFFCNDSFNYLYSISRSWTTSMGRYFLYLAEKIRGGMEMPWLIGCFSLICIAFCGIMIAEMFDLQGKPKWLLLAAILVANPTTAGTFGYMYTADGYFFGLFLAVLSAYLMERFPGWKGILLGAASLMFSMSFYQAYVSVTIMLLLIRLMLLLIRGEEKTALRRAGIYVLMGAAALVVYLIGTKIAWHITDTGPATYMGMGEDGRGDLPGRILYFLTGSYVETAKYLIVHPKVSFYNVTNVLVILADAALLAALGIKQKLYRKPLSLILLGLMGISIPLVTHVFLLLSQGASYSTPPMSYSMCMIYVLILIFYGELCPEQKGEAGETQKEFFFGEFGQTAEERSTAGNIWRMLPNVLVYGLLILVCINFIIFDNKVYITMAHANDQVENLILRIEARMEAQEGYAGEDMDVAILGNWWQKPEYPEGGPLLYSAVSNLFLNTPGEYITALNWYLATDYGGASKGDIRDAVHTEEFEQMEPWPSTKAVRRINDIMVVYLSDTNLDDYFDEDEEW